MLPNGVIRLWNQRSNFRINLRQGLTGGMQNHFVFGFLNHRDFVQGIEFKLVLRVNVENFEKSGFSTVAC